MSATAEAVPRSRYRELLAQRLGPTLVALDLERAAALRAMYTAWGFIVATAIVLAIFAEYLQPKLSVLVAAGAVLLMAYAKRASSERYRDRFKRRIIRPLVALYDASLVYEPYGGISDVEFIQSQLFRRDAGKYKSKDLVSGRIGETDVRFSEVHAQQRRERDWFYTTFFRGVVFKADFPKHFHGETYVFPDSQQWLGRLGLGFVSHALQSLDSRYGEVVKLEDPAFERDFVAYSSDQVEARYILSSALMASLVEFRRRSKRPVRVSFVGARVYVAVSCRGLFEPPLFSRLTEDDCTDCWSEIRLFAGIVEALRLNTRIWTKE